MAKVVVRVTVIGGMHYQQELVKCGRKKCSKWHGPYWYCYYTLDGKRKSKYIGKDLKKGIAKMLFL